MIFFTRVQYFAAKYRTPYKILNLRLKYNVRKYWPPPPSDFLLLLERGYKIYHGRKIMNSPLIFHTHWREGLKCYSCNILNPPLIFFFFCYWRGGFKYYGREILFLFSIWEGDQNIMAAKYWPPSVLNNKNPSPITMYIVHVCMSDFLSVIYVNVH